jgi:hypothetical protein
MAIVYSNTSDGWQASGLNASWNNVHDAVGFGAPDTNDTLRSTAVRYERPTGRTGNMYYLGRSFFDFDTSGITSTVSSATFKVKSYTNVTATPLVICKSGHDPSTTSDDWFSTWITGQGITLSGWGSANVTAYSTSTAVASVNNFTEFTLNAYALSDLVSLSSFKIAVLHEADLSDTAPTSGNLRTGFYMADYAFTSSRPHIDYTVSTGYGHDVIGVASANIGKVNGVATANIEKVIGV